MVGQNYLAIAECCRKLGSTGGVPITGVVSILHEASKNRIDIRFQTVMWIIETLDVGSLPMLRLFQPLLYLTLNPPQQQKASLPQASTKSNFSARRARKSSGCGRKASNKCSYVLSHGLLLWALI